MDLEKLFEIQGGLDFHITEAKNLGDEDLTRNKLVAFKVELGELMNEVPQTFKFWSNRSNSSSNKILEEFVDGVHFLLSLALDRKYDTYVRHIEWHDRDGEVLDMVNAIFESPINSAGQWLIVFETYLSLGLALGFTEKDIETAYLLKNTENHLRQRNGY